MLNLTDFVEPVPGGKAGAPMYMQMVENISAAVSENRLDAGVRLPSVRMAASQLRINPGTVSAAYRELNRRGFLESRPGSGHYVRSHVRAIQVSDIPDLADELYTLDDIEWMRHGRPADSQDIVNMASSIPEPDRETHEDVRAAISHVMEHNMREALDYQENMGFPPLRRFISDALRLEGVQADPDCIQIISGAQQGLDIVAKAMLDPGDTVLVEYPTYPGAVAVFRSRGARVVGVPMEADGMNPDLLMQMMRRYKPKLVYTIPIHHNPTGSVYSLERMAALVRAAESFNCHIVEDDYLRELQYDGMVRSPLKGMDTADRVILVKSYSKLLMPGLRIAYMLVPEGRSARLALAKHTTDIFTSGLIQQGFHRFCETGGWERHLARMRERLGTKYRIMRELLLNRMPDGVGIPDTGGGLSFWLELPVHVGPEPLYRMTGALGVRIVPDTVFLDESLRATLPNPGNGRGHIRVGFAGVARERMAPGIDTLADCLEILLA